MLLVLVVLAGVVISSVGEKYLDFGDVDLYTSLGMAGVAVEMLYKGRLGALLRALRSDKKVGGLVSHAENLGTGDSVGVKVEALNCFSSGMAAST